MNAADAMQKAAQLAAAKRCEVFINKIDYDGSSYDPFLMQLICLRRSQARFRCRMPGVSLTIPRVSENSPHC